MSREMSNLGASLGQHGTYRMIASRLADLRRPVAAGLVAACAFVSPVVANPDIWVSVKYLLRFDDTAMTQMEIDWRFDQYASNRISGVFDGDSDGVFSQDELEELRVRAFDPLAKHRYHMRIFSGKSPVMFKIGDFAAEIDRDNRVILSFTLSPQTPMDYRTVPISFSQRDLSSYYDFSFAEAEYLRVAGPFDPACRFKVRPGDGPLEGDRNAIALLCED